MYPHANIVETKIKMATPPAKRVLDVGGTLSPKIETKKTLSKK
jgi:hypothetical protein